MENKSIYQTAHRLRGRLNEGRCLCSSYALKIDGKSVANRGLIARKVEQTIASNGNVCRGYTADKVWEQLSDVNTHQ